MDIVSLSRTLLASYSTKPRYILEACSHGTITYVGLTGLEQILEYLVTWISFYRRDGVSPVVNAGGGLETLVLAGRKC